jgi:cell division protein FtsZ
MEHDLSDEQPVVSSFSDSEVQDQTPIIHTLENEDEIADNTLNKPMDLVPTNQTIKDISVSFEEVVVDELEEEFVINDITADNTVSSESECSEEQTMLTFDMPISEKSNLSDHSDAEVYELESETTNQDTAKAAVNDIDVNDYIELITVNESTDESEARYSLDDHIVLEQTEEKYSLEATTQEQLVDQEMTVSKVTVKERVVESKPQEESNPFNSPISKTLKDRADERRQKMKAFNYKFNSSKIDEIEKEPAYKRQGVNLSEVESSEPNVSRTSIAVDENEDVQLRSNNSFLHDNVD